jgi:hypothetical protein
VHAGVERTPGEIAKLAGVVDLVEQLLTSLPIVPGDLAIQH